MERAPGQPEQLERNLKTEPMATIEAIAQVEGPQWLSAQEAIEHGAVSTGEYETSLTYALERIEQGKSAVIYGRGGFNRWIVEGDGSVAFSESEAQSPEHLDIARQLGFPIVP